VDSLKEFRDCNWKLGQKFFVHLLSEFPRSITLFASCNAEWLSYVYCFKIIWFL